MIALIAFVFVTTGEVLILSWVREFSRMGRALLIVASHVFKGSEAGVRAIVIEKLQDQCEVKWTVASGAGSKFSKRR